MTGIERLESRTLFAGVTMLTHGWNGGLGGWLEATYNGITNRLGGPSQVPRYVLSLTPNQFGTLVGNIQHVNGTATPQSNGSGEIILVLDYTSVNVNAAYPPSTIGRAAGDFLLNHVVDGIKLVDLPIHEISLSRGTGVFDELNNVLGEAGVWVDQETYCDPYPLVNEAGDRPATIFDNVAFVDNYWRTDFDPNNADKDGYPVDGAYNFNAQWLQDHHDGYVIAHLTPAGYYVGTVNLTATNSGEGPIYSDWYDTSRGRPARDKIGFYFSRIVAGPRPLSGVWAASGGSGVRTATAHNGAQWPNISDLALANGNTVASGASVDIKFIAQDRDDGSTVTFYLDQDQNPYNNNFAATLGQKSVAASGSIDTVHATGSTSGVSSGNYWLAAKIVDGQGHTRYDYSYAQQITVGGINAHLDVNRNLRIYGTDGDDVIRIYRSPSVSDRLLVSINGSVGRFRMSGVEDVFAYGGNGNDSITFSEKYGQIFNDARLLGDAGNDTLVGGSGSDSLFGGDGNDRLYGGAGRDRLDGGLGTERLYGQSGKDWFINAKTIELLDFAKGDSLVQLT